MCFFLAEKLAVCATENRRPEPKGLEAFYSALGGTYGTGKAIFWPDSNRAKCRKFEAKAKG